jgi:hypothetical protein
VDVWSLPAAECARIGISAERAAAIGARLASGGAMPGALSAAVWISATSQFFDQRGGWPKAISMVSFGSLCWLRLQGDGVALCAVERAGRAAVSLPPIDAFRQVVENAVLQGLPPPEQLAQAFAALTGLPLQSPAPHAARGAAVFGARVDGAPATVQVAADTGVVSVKR